MEHAERHLLCGRGSEHVFDPEASGDRMELLVDRLVGEALDVRRCLAVVGQRGEPRLLARERRKRRPRLLDREASLFEQVLLPYRRQRNPEAQARTTETLGELAGLGRRLRTALLRQTVRRTITS